MSMFEEATWDAAPDVNKLDDGLFGKVRSDNKTGEVETPKLRRGQRGQKGPTERSKKWKNKDAKGKANDAQQKAERAGRPPGKHKRGKRGNNTWKKRGEDGEPIKDSEADQTEAAERKKKLKLKMKMKQGKVILPAGKSPRNKYKHLAVMREQQRNSSNDTESRIDLSKTENPQEEALPEPEPVEKSRINTLLLEISDTPEPAELGKKKANRKKIKVISEEEISDDETESVNDSAQQKKKTKKKQETPSVLACTPVESKKKKKKTTEALSEGLFTKVRDCDSDDSSSEDTQPEQSKQKKKKQKMIQPPIEDTDEPAKKKKKKTLNTENTGNVDKDILVDNVDSTKKLKKKKRKNEDSEEENVKSDHPSPQTKSPFNIGKLKHALDRKPTEDESVSDKKRKSEAVEGSPKAKAKKSEPLSLRDRMQAQLSGARFRFINEQLYTCTGEEALQLMRSDPDAFKVYHDGFTSQVEKWPENPVNRVIKYVKARPNAVVADMGCGDAKLAQSVKNTVHSFDLVAVNEHITVCDIAQLPLADDSIDVAVFCLALMGTNLVDFICEANRTLKTGGTLIIAEVVSRFEKVGAFVRKMRKLGFELSKKDDSNKMFIWFEFTKTSEVPSPDRRPNLELTPCIYKKR